MAGWDRIDEDPRHEPSADHRMLELSEPWDDGIFRSFQLDDGVVINVAADGPGRRLYFLGPDQHMLEIITARYEDVPPASRRGHRE